jgi:hypothetical protein
MSWMKAHALLPAQQVGRRHHHVVEEQLRGVLRIHAQLVKVAAPAETLHLIGLDDHQRHALRALVLVGLADHDDEVGELAVGDEGLAAVDAVAVALLDGGGAHALQVGARAGLGHGDGADQLARGQARQPALFLLFGAVVQDVGRHDARVQRTAKARLPAAPCARISTASWPKSPPAPPYSSGMEAHRSHWPRPLPRHLRSIMPAWRQASSLGPIAP